MAVITFAHRGARLEEPENTLPAFRRAPRRSARARLETDVWLSADGEVVCAHDPDGAGGLRRRRGRERTAAELAALGVPRLADVYEELGTDFELSVDLKEPAAAGRLLAVAGEHGALERLWVCTPDLDELRPLRAEPAVKLVHSTRRRKITVPLERHAHDLAESASTR